jgi:hypothetical protein
MISLTLLFHLGFGKTGTTFLQKNIFPHINNSIYFGKNINNYDMMFDKNFNEIHSQLFGPLYSTNRHRSRNSTALITKYAKYISQIVEKKCMESPNCKSIVISNESFLGYGEYNAELNILLIMRIISKIKAFLEPHDILIKPKFLTVFREQASFIQSFYSYNYPLIPKKLSNIDDFIEFGINNTHNEIFGGLFFDEVLDFIEEVFPNSEILFAPYEWLVEDPLLFIEQTIVKLGIANKQQLNEFLVEPENVNRTFHGENKIRESTNTIKILNHALKLKDLVPVFLRETMKAKVQTIQRKQNIYSNKSLKLNEEQKGKISALYSQSNAKLNKRLKIDLGALGYAL